MYKIFTLLAIVSLSTNVSAESTGQTLHQESCTSCHNSDVYTRPNRKITSRSALNKQVKRCSHAAGASWFDEDITAVADFLDLNYYKFSK